MGEEEEREEEAQRLKSLAESKYKDNKLKSALKYAKRALRLYPNLEGLSSMVTSFNILRAASKSNDVPKWYMILQAEPFCHFNTIKKQYKKLALLLHPDKSPHVGSEEAFKLINEGFRFLSDKIRRKEYDMKLMIQIQNEKMKESEESEKGETFWTACSTCRLLHQFHRKYLGHNLVCPSCRKSFEAVEVGTDDSDGGKDGDGRVRAKSERLKTRNVGDNDGNPPSVSNQKMGSVGSGRRRVVSGETSKGRVKTEELKRKGEKDIGDLKKEVGGGEWGGGRLRSGGLRKRMSSVGEIMERSEPKRVKIDEETMTLAEFQSEVKRKAQEERMRLKLKERKEQERKEREKEKEKERKEKEKEKEKERKEKAGEEEDERKKKAKEKEEREKEKEKEKEKKEKAGEKEEERKKKAGEEDERKKKAKEKEEREKEKEKEERKEKAGEKEEERKKKVKEKEKEREKEKEKEEHREQEKERREVPKRKRDLKAGTDSVLKKRKDLVLAKPGPLMRSFSALERFKGSRNSEAEIMTVEDSDFYDFDKDRVERSFKQGQIWAIYDDDDGMPRHYSLINEVVSVNPFEVKMSWLDLQSSGDEGLLDQERMGFHLSCGRFKVSRQDSINSLNIFSHVVDCERAAREVYRIYPKKGSIWALYKESTLSTEGRNLSVSDRRCYDIVVFLTTYSEMHGLSMAYLEKVDGFKTIFKRREIGSHAIRWLEKDDVRSFSHQIPARKLSGDEAPALPKDCWELDPASLPADLL